MSKFESVISDIQRQMLAGDLRPGDKLPSTDELCRRYGVSKITVNRAMDELTSAGLVVRKRGKGTFVLSTPKVKAHADLAFEVHVFSTVKPDAAVTSALALDFDDFCYYLVRTCNKGGVTQYIEYDYLPIRLAHGLRAVHIEGNIHEMLDQALNLKISNVHQTVTAYAPTAQEATWLGCNEQTALIKIEEIAYLGDGVPVEYSTIVYRPGYTFNSLSRN